MKGIYLPDTVERYVLPNLRPLTQLVLYKLLSYSGQTYREVWPSVATLCAKCNIRDKKVIRAALRDLSAWGLIETRAEFHFDEKKGKRQQTSNRYKLTFDTYEQCDLARGVKFKKRESDPLLIAIDKKIDDLAGNQARALLNFEKWCRKNKFSVDVTQTEIDISHMNPFSQGEIKQAAQKHGLVLQFKTG